MCIRDRNSLVYRTLFCVNIYGSFKLSKNSPVFWPTLYIWHSGYNDSKWENICWDIFALHWHALMMDSWCFDICDDFSRLVDFCISSVHSVAFHAHWIICVRNVALVCGTVAMCQPSSVLETTRMAFVLRPSREKHREMIHYKCRQKMLILSNSVLT